MVEIIVSMTIMLTLAVTANVYYGVVLPEQRIGRAKTDIQQFKKAIGYLKGRYKGALTSDVFRYEEDGPPWPASLNKFRPDEADGTDPTLDKLLKYQIVPSLVQDPWGQDYRVNVEKGWVYSSGPDGIAHVRDDLADDIVDNYVAKFEPIRARLAERDRVVEVEFSRELARDVRDVKETLLYQLSDKNFSVEARTVATAVLDFSSPFTIRLRLTDSTKKPASITIVRDPGDGPTRVLRSADGSRMSTDRVRLTTCPTTGWLYVNGCP